MFFTDGILIDNSNENDVFYLLENIKVLLSIRLNYD